VVTEVSVLAKLKHHYTLSGHKTRREAIKSNRNNSASLMFITPLWLETVPLRGCFNFGGMYMDAPLLF